MNMQVQGTLDVFLARQFADVARTCLDAGLDTIVRCQALERMDASALQVLVALRNGLAEKGRALWLSDVPAAVRVYLDIAGLDGIDPPNEPASFDSAEAASSADPRVSEPCEDGGDRE